MAFGTFTLEWLWDRLSPTLIGCDTITYSEYKNRQQKRIANRNKYGF